MHAGMEQYRLPAAISEIFFDISFSYLMNCSMVTFGLQEIKENLPRACCTAVNELCFPLQCLLLLLWYSDFKLFWRKTLIEY
jgi:Kef-type K+ transport system membrane component KefB